MIKKTRIWKIILCLLLCLAILSSCAEQPLPEDAPDPTASLMAMVDEFWLSNQFETAFYKAIYAKPGSDEAVVSFNYVNSLNAKGKIHSLTKYNAALVNLEGRTAVVELTIHGIDFGRYAETFLTEYDKLQASTVFLGDQLLSDLTPEQITMRLQTLPFDIVRDSMYRDFTQSFKLQYKDTGWIIKSPKNKDGLLFLELFAWHMTDILNGKYKFRTDTPDVFGNGGTDTVPDEDTTETVMSQSFAKNH